ncbi:MAG TPA: hypothetical protein VFB30_16805, partial [Spirochaetia bacterium]|nr:hypothetical protein [Spirochaetia bacterium]
MSFQSPLWLLVLLLLAPLVFFTVRLMRLRDSPLSPARRRAFILLRSAAIALVLFGLAGFAIARLSDQL